jgi:predicted transcriptional regulator
MQKAIMLSNPHTKEWLMSQTLLEMTKDLVLAQIHAHTLSPEAMHHALQQTYASLKALKAQEDAQGRSLARGTPEPPPEPVNWRQSITKHQVTCLECGQPFKLLTVKHLRDHGLDGRSYRVKYDMPRTQSLAAKEVTSRRKEIVQRIRPWQKAPTYLKAQAKAQQAVAQGKKRGRVKA